MSTHVRTRDVSDQWTWFNDYLFVWANWTVNCPADRECQVGMGVFVDGEPRGEKLRFQGSKEFLTIGVGAIHVKVVDGKGPCKVRLDSGKVGLVPIVDTPVDIAVGTAPTISALQTNADFIEEAGRFNGMCHDMLNTLATKPGLVIPSISNIKWPPIDTPCAMSEISIRNDSSLEIRVSISKTFGKGNDQEYSLPPGGVEKWDRCILGKCTIRVCDLGGELERVEYTVVSPIGANAWWDGEALIFNH